MGLDQYLYKYVPGETEEQRRMRLFGYWIVGNDKAILNYDDNWQEYVSIVDSNGNSRRNTTITAKELQDNYRHVDGEGDIMYWRKDWAIHNFMVNHTTTSLDEGDNCVYFKIPITELKKLHKGLLKAVTLLRKKFNTKAAKRELDEVDDFITVTDKQLESLVAKYAIAAYQSYNDIPIYEYRRIERNVESLENIIKSAEREKREAVWYYAWY